MCWRMQFTIPKLLLCQNVQVKVFACSQKCKNVSTTENIKSVNGKKLMKKAIKLNYYLFIFHFPSSIWEYESVNAFRNIRFG